MKNAFSILIMFCFFSACTDEIIQPPEYLGLEVVQKDLRHSEQNFKDFLETTSGQQFLQEELQSRRTDGGSATSCNCSYKINHVSFKNTPTYYFWNLSNTYSECADDCYYFTAYYHSEDCAPPSNVNCVDFDPDFGVYHPFNCVVDLDHPFGMKFWAFSLDNNCSIYPSGTLIDFQIKCCAQNNPSGLCAPNECFESEPVRIILDQSKNDHEFYMELVGCGCEPNIVL